MNQTVKNNESKPTFFCVYIVFFICDAGIDRRYDNSGSS